MIMRTDLQDILQLDPLHPEAKALMPGNRPPVRHTFPRSINGDI
jgi:hypothetical protein